MPRITVELDEHEWTVYTTKLDGMHGQCCYDTRTIQIHSGSRGKSLMDTTIHETLHAIFPDMSEREVSKQATQIANVLWKMGWRRQVGK